MNKRTFLKSLILLGLSTTPSYGSIDELISSISHLSVAEVSKDEDFWENIRKGYRLKPDYINLENGYYCLLPNETLENFINHVREVNYQGSYYMRTVQLENKKRAACGLPNFGLCFSS